MPLLESVDVTLGNLLFSGNGAQTEAASVNINLIADLPSLVGVEAGHFIRVVGETAGEAWNVEWFTIAAVNTGPGIASIDSEDALDNTDTDLDWEIRSPGAYMVTTEEVADQLSLNSMVVIPNATTGYGDGTLFQLVYRTDATTWTLHAVPDIVGEVTVDIITGVATPISVIVTPTGDAQDIPELSFTPADKNGKTTLFADHDPEDDTMEFEFTENGEVELSMPISTEINEAVNEAIESTKADLRARPWKKYR